MENEIIDFYNLYLRSVFFNFVFIIVVVKFTKDVGPIGWDVTSLHTWQASIGCGKVRRS